MAKTPVWFLRSLITAVVFAMIVANSVYAQDKQKSFSKQELEQLVAPIALHPDDLLGQILMASTYPLEIVQAARWAKANPKVKGKALEEAMQKKTWDASVKGLAAVPQVLQMMNENLEWTQKLGDAMLEQKADVLAAAQRLRAKAQKNGNLKSTTQQAVKTETKDSTTYIIIERTNPEVVYVPVYNPTIVYGAWPYPAYRPYWWYPSGYVVRRALWFGAGVAVGAAIWGNTRWRRGNVNINVNRYNSFNRTNIRNNNWKHNPRHRGAVPYRNSKTARQHGRTPRNTNRRQAHRGRTGTPRQGARPGGSGARRGTPGGGNRARSPGSGRGTGARPSGQKTGMNRRGGYSGVGRGEQTRRHSNRGNSSRSRSRQSHGGGRRGGGRRR